jgi:hypothetical protein
MAVYYFYKICSLDNEFIYIGSTTNFKKRMIEHKSNCYNKNLKLYNIKLYSTIRNNAGFDNFIFEIIDSIESDDKNIVLEHEQELMIKYNSNLNTYRSFISNAQKKAEIKINKKQYYNINKEYFQQYTIDNKEKIQQYRIDNKEQIRLKKNKKHICACGREYTNSNRKRHTKSSQHKKFEEQQIIYNTTNNITNNITFNITIQK